MDAEVFSDPEVIERQNAAFVSVWDNWRSPLAKEFWKYGGGVPVTYAVDAEGEFIRRITGLRADEYLKELSKAAKNSTRLESLRALTAREPGNGAAWWELASLERQIGDRRAALTAYEKTIDLLQKIRPRTDATSRRMGEGVYRMVVLLIKEEKIDEAKEAHRRFEELDPENKSGFEDNLAIELAVSAWSQKRNNRVSALLAEAARKYPDTDEAARLWYMIGWTQLRAGDREAARVAFMKSDALQPKSEWGQRALDTLVEHYSDESAGSFVKRLSSPWSAEREAAIRGLTKLGEQARWPLERAARSGDEKARRVLERLRKR